MALSLLRAGAFSSSPLNSPQQQPTAAAAAATATSLPLPLAPRRSLPCPGSRHSLKVVCMAHPRRVARVAKQLEREIGMLLLTDPALRAAVSPPSRERERAGSLAGIASVSEVELTANLQLARVYVSVYADAENRAPAMRALERLQPYVRRRVASAMRLRSVPEIRFLADDSVEAGEQVEAALELARLRAAGLAEPPPIVPSSRYARGNAAADGGDGWKPRSSFPDVGAAFEDGDGLGGSAGENSEDEEEEEEEGDEHSDDDEDDESDEDDDDDDGFLDLGPSSERISAAASSSSAASAPASRARTASVAVSTPPSQQEDSFFGFEPPPLEGFWPGGDVPGVLGGGGGGGGFRGRRATASGDGDDFDEAAALGEDLGDGVLGPDGFVRLAPGSGGGGGGGGGAGGGGGRRPPGGGGKPRQRPQRRR